MPPLDPEGGSSKKKPSLTCTWAGSNLLAISPSLLPLLGKAPGMEKEAVRSFHPACMPTLIRPNQVRSHKLSTCREATWHCPGQRGPESSHLNQCGKQVHSHWACHLSASALRDEWSEGMKTTWRALTGSGAPSGKAHPDKVIGIDTIFHTSALGCCSIRKTAIEELMPFLGTANQKLVLFSSSCKFYFFHQEQLSKLLKGGVTPSPRPKKQGLKRIAPPARNGFKI